jgi:hypothetical protein
MTQKNVSAPQVSVVLPIVGPVFFVDGIALAQAQERKEVKV